ncbi:MAG TPA: hypothetical protein VGK81_12975 [Anaerolineae bacterium]
MNIQIILPFEGAITHTPLWAQEEAEIDFRHDPVRAERCTSAFSATELRHYLQRTLPESKITFGQHRTGEGFSIELGIQAGPHAPDGFCLTPTDSGLIITGYSRAGLLYGAYEFLRMQGWRWIAPGKNGEIAPPCAGSLHLPDQPREVTSSFDLGRGFDFEYLSMDSAELWLWMARNRLNVCGLRPTSVALARKLGMSPKIGGHIFEAILDPERPMPSGKTLWDEHREWYGLPVNGKRRIETALATQFCVSQPGLIEYLGAELLRRLNGPWHEADRIDLWGFDTWGNTCACADCRALGNGADQILFFLARLRERVNQALSFGQLDHEVRLMACAYEGTATLAGPSGPVPQALLDAGDGVTFYPINRCYAHDLGDPLCRANATYLSALQSWLRREPQVPFVAAEYFNVSRDEDLPLLFNTRISHDLPSYHALGARGLTYMHLPLVNWAMRTLTQALYAQLAWDAHTDIGAFLDEYFQCWYGAHASEMRRAYTLIEQAGQTIADWRAWSPHSILSQLLAWDGAPPFAALQPTHHFDTPAAAIVSGRRSLELLQQALALIEWCRTEERQRIAQSIGASASPTTAVNPLQARVLEQDQQVELRLGEDRRLLRYGIDVMALMTACVQYHEGLRAGDAKMAEAAWNTLEQTADVLDSYFVPIGYEWPGPGLESKDGLTRSQLRDVLRRCRSWRMQAASAPA